MSSSSFRKVALAYAVASVDRVAAKKSRGFLAPYEDEAATESLLQMDSKTQVASDSLPPGWQQTIDPASSKTYYYNVKINVTQWNRPASGSYPARHAFFDKYADRDGNFWTAGASTPTRLGVKLCQPRNDGNGSKKYAVLRLNMREPESPTKLAGIHSSYYETHNLTHLHPNITHVHDIFTDEEEAFIVIEYYTVNSSAKQRFESKYKNIMSERNPGKVKVIGTGNNGNIHLCQNSKEKGALKILRKDGEDKSHVLREIATLKFIMKNPNKNVVKVLDIFEDRNNAYVVTELLKDLYVPLWNAARGRNNMSDIEALVKPYIYDGFRAISYLHEHSYVHFDIQFHNLMMSRDEKAATVKLIDFGHTQRLHQGEWRTHTVGGRKDHTAPEVLRGEGYARSDIWSYGVAIYLLLIGELAFDKAYSPGGKNVFALIEKFGTSGGALRLGDLGSEEQKKEI